MNMGYIEWEKRKQLIDLRNKMAPCYENIDGSIFYVEPGFYKLYEALKTVYPDRKQAFLNKMDEFVKKNRKVVFVADIDNTLVEVDGATYLSAFDITDAIGLLLEDKSRGADYGD